eukprot:Skav235124  [mRNA]  locus=scaffold3581:263211:264609:- [translate_table: standard]
MCAMRLWLEASGGHDFDAPRAEAAAESYKSEMSDDEIRLLLEKCIGSKYCELFAPAMAAAFVVYLCLAAVLPSDGYALSALAAVCLNALNTGPSCSSLMGYDGKLWPIGMVHFASIMTNHSMVATH